MKKHLSLLLCTHFLISSQVNAETCSLQSEPESFSAFSQVAKVLWSISQDDRKWDHNDLTVCWGGQENISETDLAKDLSGKKVAGSTDYLEMKQEIQKIIEASYTSKRTGIHFQGWKDCSSDPKKRKEDIVIFLGAFSEIPQTKTGNIGKNPASSERSAIMFKIPTDAERAGLLSAKDWTRLTALHEFGHIAGLLHEDGHFRAPEFFYETPVRYTDNTTLTSAYDPASIMSYNYLYSIDLDTGTEFSIDPKSGIKTKTQWEKPYTIDEVKSANYIFPKIPQTFKNDPRVKEESGTYKVSFDLSSEDVKALQCLYKSTEKKSRQHCYERVHIRISE